MIKSIISGILVLMAVAATAQVQTQVIGDSIHMHSNTATAELILENSTKNINGFLYNKGLGRTEFRKVMVKVNDTVYLFGGDTLRINTYTASNGLTMISRDVRLGGALTGNTTIDAGTLYKLSVTGNSTQNLITSANNSTGNAFRGSSAGIALFGSSTGGDAIFGSSTGGAGVSAYTTVNFAGQFTTQPASTNTIVPVLLVNRLTSGTAANGIGGAIDLYTGSSDGTPALSNRLISKLTNATTASRTSQFIITGVNNAVASDLLTLSGSGSLKLNKYGINTFSGSPAYGLAINSSGDIIETPAPLNGSATLDFPNTNTGSSSDLTITVSGAADGDVVSLGVPNASINSNSCFTAWVSSANTVTVRYNNYGSIATNPASGTFKIKVLK